MTSAVRSASRKPRASLRHAASGRLGRLRADGLISGPCASATRPRPSSSAPASCSTSPSRRSAAASSSPACRTTSSPGAIRAATRRRRSPGSPPRDSAPRLWCSARASSPRRLRYHPSVIAQAFATLGCLTPGRVFLGVGTGEAMNETPVTGGEFPGRKERRQRLAEAIELIRLLWSEERVDFEGDFYRTRKATIYDRPDEPVPIYVAASGPLAAKLAGRVGRRLHLHQRQGPGALRRAARQGRRGRRGGRPRRRADPPHDRDQGLLRPRPPSAPSRTPIPGPRWR